VKIRDALIRCFTPALLFEIPMKIFGYYVTTFPTHETKLRRISDIFDMSDLDVYFLADSPIGRRTMRLHAETV